MKRSLIFLVIVALLGGGAFLAGRKLSKPGEIAPSLKAKSEVERKSISRTESVMKKIDTDGDGIPDTFVLEGERRRAPATSGRIPEGLPIAYCYHVVDGDTIYVKLRDGTKDKIRLVGIDTPEIAHKEGEISEPGGEEAQEYVMDKVLKKTVLLDVDDLSPIDYYGRTLALVYFPYTKNKIPRNSLNAELVRRGYADLLYIPPSEFDPRRW